jgi:hypothetical protein
MCVALPALHNHHSHAAHQLAPYVRWPNCHLAVSCSGLGLMGSPTYRGLRATPQHSTRRHISAWLCTFTTLPSTPWWLAWFSPLRSYTWCQAHPAPIVPHMMPNIPLPFTLLLPSTPGGTKHYPAAAGLAWSCVPLSAETYHVPSDLQA